MDKICLIYQPCGLGDILFIQKIVNHWYNKGYKVLLPVICEYEWLNNYIDNVDFISWGDNLNKLTHKDQLPNNIIFPYKERYSPYSKNFYSEEFVFINLFQEPQGRVMEYKYQLCDLSYDDWFEYLDFKRNIIKEDELYYDILKLIDGEEYILVSKNYGSPPNFLKYNINIEVKNDIKIINLDFYNGFTLFDWCKVLENAKEIHMIESSLNYIIEKLEKKPKYIYLYTRRLNNFSEIDYLFKTDYIFKYD
jgi:hypothetical protein